MSGQRASFGERRDLAVEVAELHEAAWTDVHRKGVASGLRHHLGRTPPDQVKLKPSERMEHAQQLVKDVMGTSGGGNERLAKMIHARFDAVGLKQPAVEVRFQDLTAQSMVPASSAGGGLFTVGADLKAKAGKAAAAVTRSKQPMKSVRILQNVTGTFRPGTITLLVGPPGGGKSMLMKALCGAAPVATSGKITYNGHDLDEFNVVRTAQYVAQHNLLNSELTVRETLMFSAMCQGPGYNPGLLELLEKKEQKHGIKPDPQLARLMQGLHSTDPTTNVALTLQLLALTDCADTVVGDGMTRGISGGERKRVTSGEVMVGPSKVLFMDEISTGLDSASTFTIVQSLANWAHATDATIVVALLQPEPQVYDLFDDVMLVASGRIAYHGPRDSVLSYFSELGFVPPPKKAVADFLQEVVSRKDQPQLRVDTHKFEPQLDFVHPAALATVFRHSRIFKRTLDLHATPFDKRTSHPAALLKSMYGVPKREHLKALLWRETVLISRNSKSTTYRHIQMAWLACMVATGFLRGEVTNTNTVRGAANGLAALFFSMAYMQFLGLAECAETMMRLPVFYKQKYNLLFPGWAYAVPFATIHIPRAVLEVTMWSLVVYWGVGFEADAARFFCFWGTLVSMQLYSGSLYRMLGTTLRSLVFGTSAAVVIMLLTFLGSGFLILRNQLPPWWRWLFWVSPLQYALTGLANNEFLGPSYDRIVQVDGEDRRFGDVVMDEYQFMQGNKYRILAPVVLLAWYVVLTLVNAIALSRVPPPAMPPPAPPSEEPEYILKCPDLLGQSPKPDATTANSSADPYVTRGNPLYTCSRLDPQNRTTSIDESSHFLSSSLPVQKSGESGPVKPHTPTPPPEGGSGAETAGPVTEGDAAQSTEDSLEDTDSHTDKHEAAVDVAPHLTPPEDTVVPMPARKSSDLPTTTGPQLSFPFEPITLAFKDLKYFVPSPAGKGELQLLKNVSGVFRPGVLTALMGASGAGKTTLMDVLADRKTAGRAEGKVTVNGYEKHPASFARVMGYCEQFDVHSPGLTVAESVRLSAELRLGASVGAEDKETFVQQTLEVVELEGIGGHPVGLPGLFGLSGEQFKRLTIAVELVANPSILFMDEPTSGLDARAAQIVMRVVRAIGNNRRTIVCTIHQPSAEIFLNFDELLLLKRGGYQIFYGQLGKDSQNLVDYFQSVPGAVKLSQGYNPATYMLEATTRSEEERLGVDFADIWQKRQRESVLQAVEPFMAPVATTKQLQFSDKYAKSRFYQFKVLFGRYFKAYWRSPPYNTTRLILALIAALLLGTFYFSRGDKYSTPGDLLSVLGALLISVMFVGFINFQMIIPTFYMERPVMWRERASAMYAVLPWVEAMQDVEIPWVALQVSVFSIVAYFMIGFELHAGKFFFYWLALNLSCLSMVYFGMLVVCITPNMHMGITLGATVLGMWFVFAGFMIPRPEIPLWWRWFSYLCPPGWTLQAIISSQLGDKEDRLTGDFDEDGVDRQRTLKQFIEDEYGFEHSFRWPALGILLLFVVAMRLTVALTTKTLHWQKR